MRILVLSSVFSSVFWSGLASLLIFCASFSAHADTATADLIPKDTLTFNGKQKMGWTPTASLGLNMNLSSSSNVVGQTDGTSEAYGTSLKGSYGYKAAGEEWDNSLSYDGALAKTTALPQYVKSNDDLKYETLYLHTLESVPTFGPYFKGLVDTNIFMGQDVRSGPTTYNTAYLNGSNATTTSSTYRLTDGFRPLTTRESVGGFWKAFDDGNVHINARLGLGAEQIAADGQYAVMGVNPDGSVGIKELRSVSQAGVEAAFTGDGKIDEKTAWALGAEVLTPFVSNKPANDSRDPLRLTDVDGFVKLTSKITSWISLSYDYKLIIQPQLVDRTQQAHLLLVNVNYNLM